MPDLTLADRRILFVVPPGRFDERMFYQSWQLLAEQGAWLAVASPAPSGVASGESGATIHTIQFSDVKLPEWDALLVVEKAGDPGEWLPDAAKIALAAVESGRIVAAHGHLGSELFASGIPVIRNGRSLSRFIAELSVRVSKAPARSATPVEPVRHR